MRIIIFWDSIAEWLWDYEKWGWPQRLKTHFWKKSGYDTQVISFWISAHTSTHLKNYIKTCFDAVSKRQEDKYKESIVIIALWINDSAISIQTWKNQVDFEVFKSNIRQISEYLKHEKLIKKAIFLENINVIESLINNLEIAEEHYFYNSEIQRYNLFIQEICNENHFEFFSLFWAMKEDDLQIDGLHPNSDWHEKIYQQVSLQLEKNIFNPIK